MPVQKVITTNASAFRAGDVFANGEVITGDVNVGRLNTIVKIKRTSGREVRRGYKNYDMHSVTRWVPTDDERLSAEAARVEEHLAGRNADSMRECNIGLLRLQTSVTSCKDAEVTMDSNRLRAFIDVNANRRAWETILAHRTRDDMPLLLAWDAARREYQSTHGLQVLTPRAGSFDDTATVIDQIALVTVFRRLSSMYSRTNPNALDEIVEHVELKYRAKLEDEKLATSLTSD